VRSLKFAIVLLSSISAIIPFPGTTSADSLIASCAEISLSLNLDREICNGKVSASQAAIESISKEETQRSKLNDLAVVLRRIGHLDAARVVITQILKQEPANRVALLSAANITQAEYLYSVSDLNDAFNPEARYLASTTGLEAAQRAFNEGVVA
jgi:hypothetical protein